MITIYDRKVTSRQFAKYAVLSYGAFTARDYWYDHAELGEAYQLMTNSERGIVDRQIIRYVNDLLEKQSYWKIHEKVFED